ncbi:hypothetical protein GMOD_00004046 [Pyrenophora seminiperda CCB06]|uniref:Uncharacterized protein n=1 Tax=Pyrenophora seminiperda CCB06 TaxID=1302712 RepID=A0A3M7M0G5_9PLEO|nr:hypothetical protein GMOD_00004046 [Pyrenophora seminiperda CCB06]
MVKLDWLGSSTGYTMSTPISIILWTIVSYFCVCITSVLLCRYEPGYCNMETTVFLRPVSTKPNKQKTTNSP